jgi:hypothetical protein
MRLSSQAISAQLALPFHPRDKIADLRLTRETFAIQTAACRFQGRAMETRDAREG